MMNACTRLLCLLSIVILLIHIVSCNSGGDSAIIPGGGDRMLLLDLYDSNGVRVEDGSSGVQVDTEVGFLFGVTRDSWIGLPPDDLNVPAGELVTRIEVDPGDGSGWVDFTDSYLANRDVAAAPYHGRHSYQNAGEYLIRARATYWDGEVVYFEGELLIEVLPGL